MTWAWLQASGNMVEYLRSQVELYVSERTPLCNRRLGVHFSCAVPASLHCTWYRPFPLPDQVTSTFSTGLLEGLRPRYEQRQTCASHIRRVWAALETGARGP